MTGAVVYLDQSGADEVAVQFLEARAMAAVQQTPHVELRWATHETDGRTGSLWIDGKLSACTVVLRDDLNRSAVVTFEAAPPSRQANEWRDYVDSFVGAAALRELQRKFAAGARVWDAKP